jgi:hypothetical protein
MHTNLSTDAMDELTPLLAAQAVRTMNRTPAANAGGLSTLKPFAYCIQDEDGFEYNRIDEFSCGRSNGIELYTAAQVQAILDDRATATSAEGKDAERFVWWFDATPGQREDAMRHFYSANPKEGIREHDIDTWRCCIDTARQDRPAASGAGGRKGGAQ